MAGTTFYLGGMTKKVAGTTFYLGEAVGMPFLFIFSMCSKQRSKSTKISYFINTKN